MAGIQLGYETEREPGFGFHHGQASSSKNNPIVYDGEGPIARHRPDRRAKAKGAIF